jgi:Protein of unknown function (DUF2380)
VSRCKGFRAVTFGLALCLLPMASALPADAPLKTIVLLDFELVDSGLDHASDEAQRARLQAISRALRQEFTDRHFYTVLDNGPAETMIADYGRRFILHDCNGCDTDVGKAMGADRILTGWVQKVSNLILNINIQIRDVRSGRVVLTRSVDIRGNTDASWLRGVRYLARGMDEAHQGNR